VSDYRSVVASKDNTSVQNFSQPDHYHKGRGANERLLAGKLSSGIVGDTVLRARTFMSFNLDGFWDDVFIVESAVLELTVAGDGDFSTSNTARLMVRPLTAAFSEGTHSNFVNADYEWPTFNTTAGVAGDVGTGDPQSPFTLDVKPLLRKFAPKRVNFEGLGNGEAKDFYGFVIMGDSEKKVSATAQFWGSEAATADYRPRLTITYRKANEPPQAYISGPVGSVASNFTIDGQFGDTEYGSFMSNVQVQVRKSSATDWSGTLVVDATRHIPGITTVAEESYWSISDFDRSNIRKAVSYDVRARTFDNLNEASPWTEPLTFTVTADAPTVIVQDNTTISSSDGLTFTGTYTTDELTEGVSVDVQVGTPGFGSMVWAYSYPLTLEERGTQTIDCPYLGPVLVPGAYPAGTYWVRIRLTDALGGVSNWSTFILTVEGTPPEQEDNPEMDAGYSSFVPAQRIVIRDMDAGRGPRSVIAIIEDFANLGVSWYASAPGELYFSLPVTHPQVSVIEPMVTHYSYEQYRRGRWVTLAEGLIRDFDAKETDIIFYGIDYLGLLSLSVEAAKQTTTEPLRRMGAKATDIRGSRYFRKTIKSIIIDQLERARKQDAASPVKFIETGRIDNFATKVTIYASFAERLSFIRGLIDSHKGANQNGEERRSRLRVRFNRSAGGGQGRYQFEALDGVGVDRNNLRLEYGSVIQGYQVIALDDFATRVYGIGKVPNATLPYFSSVSAPGIDQSVWGSIGRANFWSDIVDEADLQRRSRALGTRLSRIGKRIALGLRVSGIGVFDGYDILDSFPISIEDGVVSTSAYGSGYWTLWGMEYRVYPDEHDEVTFILRPKGDTDDIDPDLIPSHPIHSQSDIVFGAGEP
jgi:hypothetical protein